MAKRELENRSTNMNEEISISVETDVNGSKWQKEEHGPGASQRLPYIKGRE